MIAVTISRDALLVELAQLRAENERLRDLLRRWADLCACACDGSEALAEEASEA